MLHQATELTAQFADRLTYIWQDAQDIPFDDDTFDAVTCLEALEFTPDPRAVLAELVRVLRPGGVLLTTNRIGRDVGLLPGRTFPRDEFAQVLSEFPLEQIKVRSWQMDYDLAWAIKIGEPHGGSIRPLAEILRCPACRAHLARQTDAFHCTQCSHIYPVAKDGVVEMARPR
jgi:SAM-dependent methyltransferase